MVVGDRRKINSSRRQSNRHISTTGGIVMAWFGVLPDSGDEAFSMWAYFAGLTVVVGVSAVFWGQLEDQFSSAKGILSGLGGKK